MYQKSNEFSIQFVPCSESVLISFKTLNIFSTYSVPTVPSVIDPPLVQNIKIQQFYCNGQFLQILYENKLNIYENSE